MQVSENAFEKTKPHLNLFDNKVYRLFESADEIFFGANTKCENQLTLRKLKNYVSLLIINFVSPFSS